MRYVRFTPLLFSREREGRFLLALGTIENAPSNLRISANQNKDKHKYTKDTMNSNKNLRHNA